MNIVNYTLELKSRTKYVSGRHELYWTGEGPVYCRGTFGERQILFPPLMHLGEGLSLETLLTLKLKNP
jgi:hypothetical protein